MELKNGFWSFSVGLYTTREDVADACLALQDELGADVNLLLFGLWTATAGLRLDKTQLTAAVEAAGPWHYDIVVPLRNLRRRLKSGPSPAPSRLTDDLRGQLKSDELSAEQIEQAVLYELAMSWRPGRLEVPEQLDAAASNLVALLHLHARHAPEALHTDLLAVLIAAAFPQQNRTQARDALLHRIGSISTESDKQ